MKDKLSTTILILAPVGQQRNFNNPWRILIYCACSKGVGFPAVPAYLTAPHKQAMTTEVSKKSTKGRGAHWVKKKVAPCLRPKKVSSLISHSSTVAPSLSHHDSVVGTNRELEREEEGATTGAARKRRRVRTISTSSAEQSNEEVSHTH